METTDAVASPAISVVYAYHSKDPEYDKYRDMMVDSVKTTYPGVTVYAATFNDPSYMMVERPSIYAQARRHIRGTLVFLDIDIIAMRPMPQSVLAKDFDVAVVPGNKQNNYPLMPWCGGVQIWKDTPKAQEYADIVAHAAVKIPEGMLVDGWWADQLSLAYGIFRTPDLKWMELPWDKFNFVPEGAQGTMAYFVHCKGTRKHLMRQYYNCVKKTDHTGF